MSADVSYRADAPVGSADSAGVHEVVFYQLERKFVDSEKSIPDESEEVLYYTLAVGHHTGVIDCLSEKFRVSRQVYAQACALLEEGSDARYKLEGIERSGEIQVTGANLGVLLPALDAALEANPGSDGFVSGEARAVLVSLKELLEVLAREPAAYVMGRRRGA